MLNINMLFIQEKVTTQVNMNENNIQTIWSILKKKINLPSR